MYKIIISQKCILYLFFIFLVATTAIWNKRKIHKIPHQYNYQNDFLFSFFGKKRNVSKCADGGKVLGIFFIFWKKKELTRANCLLCESVSLWTESNFKRETKRAIKWVKLFLIFDAIVFLYVFILRFLFYFILLLLFTDKSGNVFQYKFQCLFFLFLFFSLRIK